jgi:ribosome biogenesis GTPase A
MNINQLKDKKFLILLIGHPLVGKSTFIKISLII